MPDVPSSRVQKFFAVTRKLSQEKRAELVGRSPESLRRWKRQAERGATVPIDPDAWARMEEFLADQPPADVDAYRQGMRAAMQRMQELLETMEAELSAPAGAADPARVAAQQARKAQQAAQQAAGRRPKQKQKKAG